MNRYFEMLWKAAHGIKGFSEEYIDYILHNKAGGNAEMYNAFNSISTDHLSDRFTSIDLLKEPFKGNVDLVDKGITSLTSIYNGVMYYPLDFLLRTSTIDLTGNDGIGEFKFRQNGGFLTKLTLPAITGLNIVSPRYLYINNPSIDETDTNKISSNGLVINNAWNIKDIKISDNHSINAFALICKIMEVQRQEGEDETTATIDSIDITQVSRLQEIDRDTLDIFARDYLGVQMAEEDSYASRQSGCDFKYKNLSIHASSVYADTKDALRIKGISIDADIVYVRNISSILEPFFESADSDGDGYVTLEEASKILITTQTGACFTGVSNYNNIKSLGFLQYFSGISYLPSRTSSDAWIGGASDYSSCVKIGSKYLQYFASEYTACTKITRLVMPSLVHISSGFGGSGATNSFPNCVFFDFGPRLSEWTNTSTGVTNGTIILRKNSTITPPYTVSFDKVFVPFDLVASYKAISEWSALNIYAIGGPTWQEEFAENAAARGIEASSPYADLTDEEQLWYDDLFPNLYENWVAPTTDE